MKKIVWTFGLIGGAILSATMLATLPFHEQIGFETLGMLIGYTSMVIAFLLIYFGVRSYRENVAGGSVRFGRAFGVGMLIALVASACYVGTWEVIYYRFTPNYMAKYNEHMIEKARASGASEAELAQKRAEMAKFEKLYDNPIINVAMTFAEPLPVALIVSLVTAGLLSKKRREPADGTVVAGARAST